MLNATLLMLLCGPMVLRRKTPTQRVLNTWLRLSLLWGVLTHNRGTHEQWAISQKNSATRVMQ